MIKKGYLIAIEGGDGCGTTTHSKILARGIIDWISILPDLFLKDSGLNGEVIVTKGPSDSNFGKIIREKFELKKFSNANLATMAFALDRFEQYESQIRDQLEKGCIVIYDRYIHSSLVHQSLQGADLDYILKCNEGLPFPDLIFHLRSDFKTIKTRICSRVDDPMANLGDLDREIKSQIDCWNNIWKEISNLGFPFENFEPYEIETRDAIPEVSKKMLAISTSNVLQRMLENSKKKLDLIQM
jgi:dTMP kinase